MQLRRIDDDTFQLDLLEEEAAFLVELCEGLRARILAEAADDDPDLARLSPPGHAEDPDVARQYREVVGDDLRASRLAALDTMIGTARQGRTSRDDLECWLAGLNALRLVLGTRLGVGDDHDPDAVTPDDPAFAEHQLYADLSAVLGLILHVLSAP